MKKMLILGLTVLLLAACNNVEEQSSPVQEPETESEPIKEVSQNEKEHSREELNAKLKEEAVKADFIEMNVENPPNGKKVFAEGEVSVITKGVINDFLLTTKEGDAHGMYRVILFNLNDFEFNKGDIVRIYGVVDGKDESGFPKISATIIEDAQ